ncbi:MAG: hypothetical protein Q4B58_04575 [Bacteroidales bacterium]|nr:hypothetical protein [Bacteroidales bacterium]
MMLKRLIFSLLCLVTFAVSAQTTGHDLRVEQVKQRWLNAIPCIGTLQYAGDIGFLSLGLGWDYGKNDRWETHLQIGFLPKLETETEALTFTLRESFVPWSLGLGKRAWVDNRKSGSWNRRAVFSFEPAVFSLFINSIFNDEFWVKEPDKYNDGDYYRFSSKMRIHLGIGSRISLNVPHEKRTHFERVSFYYEVSTYDLAIISAIPNKAITLGDILCLGIGLQYKFF